ncbi:MAG: serine protease [candidate division Zixibacteria bacterium]|nr:serine protease [candidate division Zixibacteria bacterium]
MLRLPIFISLFLLVFLTANLAEAKLPTFDEKAVVKIFVYDNVDTISVPIGNHSYIFAVPQAGHGSGTIIDSSGVILTARHVIEGARFVSVYIPTLKFFYPAEVIYADDSLDFAFLYIEGNFASCAALPDSSPGLHKGDEVWAYGYPVFAGEPEASVNSGTISLYSNQFNWWQMDTHINEGNSGGPLVDENGRIVGVAVAGLKKREGMNYALPIDEVIRTYRELWNRGDIRDVKERVSSMKYEKRQIRNTLADFVGKVTIDGKTFFQGNATYGKVLDKMTNIETEKLSTEMGDFSALASAYYFDMGTKVLAENGLTYASLSSGMVPVETIREFTSALAKAMLLAQVATKIDPSLQKSDYISIMNDLYSKVKSFMDEDKGGGSIDKGTDPIGLTNPATMGRKTPESPVSSEPYAGMVVVEWTRFQPNEDVDIEGIKIRDIQNWYNGVTVWFLIDADEDPGSKGLVSLSYYKSRTFSQSSDPVILYSEGYLKSVSIYQGFIGGSAELKIIKDNLCLWPGIGLNIGCYKGSRSDNKKSSEKYK